MAASNEASRGNTSGSSEPSNSSPAPPGNYTFLVANVARPPGSHDLSHVSTDKTDRFAHTRTKRKRTSQEDFGVLESEYQGNPKPDKDTRASLASRVSLSEKEIQVWFQNRRQMTRRKRHTWQPNEITSIIRSSQENSRDGHSRPISRDSSFGMQTLSRDTSQVMSGGNSSQTEEDTTTSEESTCQEDRLPSSQDTVSLSQPYSNSTGETDNPKVSSSLLERSQAFTPRKLKRTSSTVRISMSLDGQASVIIRGQTPSPPSKTTSENGLARSVLQRSRSMISQSSLASSQDVPQPPSSSIPRIPGRSRDTRNWEFWCDSERRESLTKSAEIDQRGSAAGPISLIRSSSSGIKSLARTELVSRKRKSEESADARPKLSRTKSSYARLQSSENVTAKNDISKTGSTTIHVDGGDSDKENVDPEACTTVPIQRRIATPRVLGNKRQALQENKNLPSHSTSLGVLLAKEKEKTPAKAISRRDRSTNANADKENIIVDDEVAGFMKGNLIRREEDDLDVAQNLLRLSQGAWR